MGCGVKPTSPPSDFGVWRTAWPLALVATLIWASAHSQADVGLSFVGWDKIVHFHVFGLLGTLLARLAWVRRLSPLGAFNAVVLVSLFAVTDEVHQSFTPGRSMDWLDWVADTSGAWLATTLYVRWTWYRTVLEWALFRRRQRDVETATQAVSNRAA